MLIVEATVFKSKLNVYRYPTKADYVPTVMSELAGGFHNEITALFSPQNG